MGNSGKSSRRDFVIQIARGCGATFVGGVVLSSAMMNNASGSISLRPPGAINSDSFLAHCLKCGLCVTACPYDTLKLVDIGKDAAVGAPYFKPRIIACEMCEDIPCTVACPSGALELDLVSERKDNGIQLNINNARMGIAKVDTDNCVAYWGLQCDVCYRACPLIDEAISLEYVRNERTGEHAKLRPVVNGDACTGCGKCENVCITEEASIIVLPLDIAVGKVGSKYVKGWNPEDESRIRDVASPEPDQKAKDKALDYLNTDDLLDD
jgi:ferredoxin-type protein NapG